eukprot:SAG31_NODE_393_length_16293_cov_15.804372_2_plen_77_part_00
MNGSFMRGAQSTRADVAACCVAAASSTHCANTTFEMACDAPFAQSSMETVQSDWFEKEFASLQKNWGEGEWRHLLD